MTGGLVITAGVPPSAPTTTPLATPTLTVTPSPDGTANLCSWSAIAGATQYRLQKSLDLGVSYGVPAAGLERVITSPTLSFDDSGISPNVTRYYRLRAEAPSDATKANSAYHTVGPYLTIPTPTGPPLPTTYSYFIPGQPNSRGGACTGGQQAGGYDFVITSLSDSSSYTANYAGKGATWYSGTWRGARDFSFTLAAGTPLRVKRAISGKCATSGFFGWTKSNATIDLISGPAPGFFFDGMQMGWIGCDNVIVAGMDISMDNNVSVADMDNRDTVYVGDCGLIVFFGPSSRWGCDELYDFVDHVQTKVALITRGYLDEPLSNAGRPAPDDTHGYWLVVGYNGKYVDVIQNVFGDGNGRGPHFRSNNCNFLDNVIINCGYQNTDPVKFAGWGEFCADVNQGGAPKYNVMGNKYVNGPNPGGTSKPIQVVNNRGDAISLTSSARICVRDNYVRDYLGVWGSIDHTNAASFVDTVGDAIPSGALTTTIQTSIYPTSYTVWTLTLVGTAVSTTEFDDCVDWMLDHCGYRPGDRSAGRDAVTISHHKNWMAQNGGTYPAIIDDESQAGGHFSVPVNTSDIFSGAIPEPTGAAAEALVLCTDGLYRMARDIVMLGNWALAGHQAWGVAA